MGRPSEERSRDEVGPIRSLKSGLAAKGSVGMNEINPMMRSAAIQKLIAERAYELWENQGRPYGCDLIHWHEAEQEIMGCVRRSSFRLKETRRSRSSSRSERMIPAALSGHRFCPGASGD